MKANYKYRYIDWVTGLWESVHVDLEKDEFYRETSGRWHKNFSRWSTLVDHPDTTIKLVGPDNVNSPSHYNESGIECIEAIRASLGPKGFQAYCKGNCQKYLWRYEYKNGIEDLEKAQVYLGWMIDSINQKD